MRLVAFVVSLNLVAPLASGWDRLGHMVVCAIAWDSMTEEARAGAVSLLQSAPEDAGLKSLSLQPRELFARAGYWADVVRDDAFPGRKAAYDRPTWHYVNHFWNEHARLPEMGTAGDLVDRLSKLEPGKDAVDLAWFLHLVADVHQPLHSSGRVTTPEPKGDRGGNDFLLDDPEASNLHAYWDTVLKRGRRRLHSESQERWVERLAETLQTDHPREGLQEAVANMSYLHWSEEGMMLAMRHVYPKTLGRGQAPPASYQADALELAESQIVLAGYRLAAALNRVFD